MPAVKTEIHSNAVRAWTLPSGRLRILQLTDTHLFAAEDGTLKGVNTRDTLRAVLYDINLHAWRPDLIVVSGDLVHDESPAGYAALAQMLLPLDRPVCVLPGNHDKTDVMRACLSDPAIRLCGSIHNDRWRIILLDSAVAGQDYGELSRRELARLDSTLAHSHEPFALVCIHHHLLPIGSRWLDTIGVHQADSMLDVLSRHTGVRGILCGHIHQAFASRHNEMSILGSPSTCVQFLPGSDEFALDDKPPGYRRVELNPDGAIKTEVRWLCGDPDILKP